MLSDEEKKAIEEQYKKGLVNLSDIIEPLINQFKVDFSLDIQQCRLIINYLLMERDFNETYYDELDKEIEELKEIVETLRKENVSLYIERRQKENKIKAKIEEYDDKGMTINLTNRSVGKTFQQAVHYEVRKVLQLLLNKE